MKILIPLFFLFVSNDAFSQTTSVTTFGYDRNKSGQVNSSLYYKSKLRLIKHGLLSGEITQDALKFMPLYLSAEATKSISTRGKRIVVFTTATGVKAVDVDDFSIVWKIETSEIGKPISTPVIDLKHENIFINVSRTTERGPEKHLIQANLNGEILKIVNVNLDGVYSRLYPNLDTSDWGKVQWCKTALGLNDATTPSYIFFGCSMQAGRNHKYGNKRGPTGMVLAYKLDEHGIVNDGASEKVFFASRMTSNPWTGYDSGIYNLGSGPTVLDDGSLLVATGNGPVFFEDLNFGCSIVKLDASLTPARNLNSKFQAFSIEGPGINECWFKNNEYASSSVSTTRNSQYGATVTKDGHLEVFDIDNMNPGRENVASIKIGQRQTYGQPAILETANGMQIIANATRRGREIKLRDKFLATKAQLSSIPDLHDYTCYGWLMTEGRDGHDKLLLLYSGRGRNDYANVNSSSSVYKKLTTFRDDTFGRSEGDYHITGHWAPYLSIGDLGYSVPPDTMIDDENVKLEKLNPLEFIDGSTNRESVNSLREDLGTYVLKNLDQNRDCEKGFDLNEYTPIYYVDRRKTIQPASPDQIVSASFNEQNGSLTLDWEHTLSNGERLQRFHPMISTDGNSKNPIVLGFSYEENSPDKSILLLINGTNGNEISRYTVDGRVHFSMPLVFDELVIVPTTKGMQVFEVLGG